MVAILDFQSERFYFFLFTSYPDASYQVSSQLAFRFRKRSEKGILKMATMQQSWISDWNDLSYFWSTSQPDDSYQVSSQLAFRFRRESENRFSRWPSWWPRISKRKDFCYFWSTSYPDASYQVSGQLAFRFRRRRQNSILKMAAMATILDFWSDRF